MITVTMAEKLTDSISTENVVASTSIGQELDLEALCYDLLGVEYDPSEFPGIVYRIQDPKSTCLIYRSGRIVCTGAGSIKQVNEAFHSVFDDFRDLGIEIGDPDIFVVNVVSCADVRSPVNLNAAAIGLGLEFVEYEPEQFPGLVYRPTEHGVVILLFSSGKVVITGATDTEAPPKALKSFHADLESLGLLS